MWTRPTSGWGWATGCAVALGAALLAVPGPVGADDMEAALDRLDRAAQADPNLSGEFKASLRDLVDALRAERTADAESYREVVDGEDYFVEHRQRMTLFGDMRLRHESNVELDDVPDRHRERARFRMGMTYDIADTVTLGARAITGNAGDPNSPHETFGNTSTGSGLTSWTISLDRAYLTWKPALVDGLAVTGGKFGHPFKKNPVYGELVWDGDIQPEGYKLTYQREELGPVDTLFLAHGGYVLQEQGAADEATLWVWQGALQDQVTEDWSVQGALGFYHYLDINPDGSAALAGMHNAGNRLNPTGTFMSDFRILNPIVAATWSGWEAHPMTLAGELIHNTDAEGGDDDGWAVGVSTKGALFGRPTTGYYQYQVVEREAVFSPFAQDDFLFQTNHRSHVAGLKVKLEDRIGLHLWGLFSERDETTPGVSIADSDDTQVRLRADLNVKF